MRKTRFSSLDGIAAIYLGKGNKIKINKFKNMIQAPCYCLSRVKITTM